VTGPPAMSLLRFRLRSIMILVAVGALTLGAHLAIRRRADYLRIARNHKSEAEFWSSDAGWWKHDSEHGFGFRRLVEYHDSMRLKYERAARFPWLAIEPDPPDPGLPPLPVPEPLGPLNLGPVPGEPPKTQPADQPHR
jgi:hypothetical protein